MRRRRRDLLVPTVLGSALGTKAQLLPPQVHKTRMSILHYGLAGRELGKQLGQASKRSIRSRLFP